MSRLVLACGLFAVGVASVVILNVRVLPNHFRNQRPPPPRQALVSSHQEKAQVLSPALPDPPASTGTPDGGRSTGDPTTKTDSGPELDGGQNPIQELEDLYFETGSPVLTHETKGALARLAQIMLEDVDQSVIFKGHADERGTYLRNLSLSEERAAAAAAYLIGQGVPRRRVYYEGVGEKRPVSKTNSPIAWARNRRVEVIWR